MNATAAIFVLFFTSEYHIKCLEEEKEEKVLEREVLNVIERS
jgi:hypothetical protein